MRSLVGRLLLVLALLSSVATASAQFPPFPYPFATPGPGPATGGPSGALVPVAGPSPLTTPIVPGVPGDPANVAILANGWQANVTWKGMTCAGATSAYAFSATNPTPTFLTLNVNSPGFDTTGAPTTVTRQVSGTLWLRQPEPNNLLPTESFDGTNCTTTLVLSDFVNNSDTVTSATFASGVYTSNLTSNAKTVSVSNGSTWAHYPPICSRVTEDNLPIEPANTFTVEVACFHARPLNGKEVQAVKFTASDGTHTASVVATQMTASARVASLGNTVYVYSGTFAAGAFSAFNAGNISIDAVAYPITGDVSLDFANGQDGTPIAYTAISPNLKPFREVYDGAGHYTDVYAWVETTGTCSTTACINTTATDPGTGAALNYVSIAAAATQCQAYNNANRSHNDYGGCHVMVRAATYNGYNQATGGSLDALTPGLSWMTVQGAPGTTTSTVVIKPSATGTGDTNVNNRIKFVGIGFAQADTTSSAYNVVMIGQDGSNANPITTEVLLDGCLITTTVTSQWPMFFQIGLTDYYDTTINQTAGDGKLTLPFGAGREAMLFYGNHLIGPAANPIALWLYTALGNWGDGIHVTAAADSTTDYVAATGFVDAFNRWMNSDWPVEITKNGTSGMFIPAGNAAFVQNVNEKVVNDSGPNVLFLGDGDETPFKNEVVQYETNAGQRYNEMYNDGTPDAAACTPKYGTFWYTAVDPAPGGFNVKRDTFVNPVNGENPARICNWDVSHHVGSLGNVVNNSGNGTVPSSTGWLGEYYGLLGLTQVSVAFTTNNSVSGTDTGNGNYVLTGGSASPAYGRVPSGQAALPFDLNGIARHNDGTGAAGAYELPPTPSLLWLIGDTQVFSDAGVTPAVNNGIIAQWNDQSGAGNKASQATTGKQWTYNTNLLNGHAGMCNSVTTAFMTLPADVIKGQFTAYAVWKQNSLVGFESPFGSSVIDSLVLATDNSSPAKLALGQSGVSAFTSNLTMAAGGWHITSWRSGGIEAAGNVAGRTVAAVRQDGVNGTGLTEGNALANLTNGNVTTLFSDRGLSGTAINGCMVEMMVDGKVDGPSTVLATEQYLANKYGLSLAAQPTYSLTPAGMSSWSGTSTTPAIARGGTGQFDSNDVEGAACLGPSDGESQFYCYYTGWNAGYTNAGIGLATGVDPSHLTKFGEVLSPGASGFDTAWVSCPTIKHIGSFYILGYCGSTTTGFEAGHPQGGFAYATSPTGPFTRSSANPIIPLGSGGAWDANAIFEGDSIVDNGTGTTFIYYNASSTSGGDEQMGCVTTPSPLTPTSNSFTKCAGNPIFNGGSTWNVQRVFNFRVFPNGSGGYIGFYAGNYADATANCGQVGIKTNTGDLVTWTDYANNPISVVGGGVGAGCVGRLGPVKVNGQWWAFVDDVLDSYVVKLDYQP